MIRAICFDASPSQHIETFIDELLEVKSKHITPYYGIFNDRLIIVKEHSTKSELLKQFRSDWVL